mgnify:CR=1
KGFGCPKRIFYFRIQLKNHIGWSTYMLLNMNEKASIKKLIEYIESRLEVGEYKDSVHKIKLITTREMILEIISK